MLNEYSQEKNNFERKKWEMRIKKFSENLSEMGFYKFKFFSSKDQFTREK